MNEPKPLPSETKKLVETPLTGEAMSPIAADLVHLDALSNARSKVYKDGPVSNWPAANREFVHALERFYRTHRAALASLADELRLAQTELKGCYRLIDELKEDLRLAREEQIALLRFIQKEHPVTREMWNALFPKKA